MTSVLLNAFRETFGNLEVLHLGVDEFEDPRIDWLFLGYMEKLKDVRLMTSRDHETGERILEALPANQLSSLVLWSSDIEVGFWTEDQEESVSDIAM